MRDTSALTASRPAVAKYHDLRRHTSKYLTFFNFATVVLLIAASWRPVLNS